MSEFWDKYRDDPRWLLKRTEILEAAGYRCAACGESNERLTVHHGYYKFKTPPWDYEDNTLWCLCWPCHERYQVQLSKIHHLIGRVQPREYEKLLRSMPDQISLAQFGATEAEIADVLNELEQERQKEAILFGAYSAILTENCENGPSNAEIVAREAERTFPGLSVDIDVSDNDPDLNMTVDGPKREVVERIEKWFLVQQERRS